MTAESEARRLLVNMGFDAENTSSGDLVELANLIAENSRMKARIAELETDLRIAMENPPIFVVQETVETKAAFAAQAELTELQDCLDWLFVHDVEVVLFIDVGLPHEYRASGSSADRLMRHARAGTAHMALVLLARKLGWKP